jgi:predicted RNase H-like HicB family nuclease
VVSPLPCFARLWRGHMGNTQEEALKHIQEVVQMVIEELLEDGEPIPEDVQVSQEPLMTFAI